MPVKRASHRVSEARASKVARREANEQLAQVYTPDETEESNPVHNLQSKFADSYLPPVLLGREEESAALRKFFDSAFGSLYVSGSPGTGKTVTVRSAIQNWRMSTGAVVVEINAMSLKDPRDIFFRLTNLLLGFGGFPLMNESAFQKTRSRAAAEKSAELAELAGHLRAAITKLSQAKRGRKKTAVPVLMLVDEVDALCPKSSRNVAGAEVLIRLMETATEISRESKAKCPVMVVGIANSVDLTQRLMPLFHSRNVEVQEQVFAPYSAAQLRQIVIQRTGGSALFDTPAIELCVRKVAAFHGDCRKVLDLCRQAVNTLNSSASSKVGMMDAVNVLDRCYRKDTDSDSALKALPLQQQLLLCAIILAAGQKGEASVTEIRSKLGEVVREFSLPTCSAAQVMEFAQNLESSGLLSLSSIKGISRLALQSPVDTLAEALTRATPLLGKVLGTTRNPDARGA